MDSAPGPAPRSTPVCSSDNSGTVKAWVIVAVVGLFALHVLGSLRRRSSNSLLHATVMAVSTLSYSLVGYIVGEMRRSDFYYYDFAVWAVFVLLLLGSTDSLTACRLDDIDDWRSIYVKHLYKASLVVIVIVYTIGGNRDTKYLWWPLAAFLFVGVVKCYVRIASMRMVSKSYLCREVKVIAEYMQHKDNLLVPFDPVTMQGYSYIVDGEKYCVVAKKQPADGRTPWYRMNSNVTTVEQVWQCTGRLLHLGKRGKLLKDLCLSMALSKMLNRRFAGFELSESHLEKTHDLVFKGLLAGDDDAPHERAFRVIEEELAFIHDLYYTRYYYLHQKGRYMALCPPVVMFALCSWLTYVLIKNYNRSLNITVFITVVLAFLELYQLYLYIASGWFKVALILSYISTPSSQRNGCCLEMIIGRLVRLKAIQPWKDTLGQYCLLQDLGRRSSWFRDCCFHYATLGLMDKAPARKKKKGRKSSVKLSKNVKKAIAESLLGSNGYLTNGVTSLQNNGVHARLAWACDASSTQGSVTRTILVWHVATTLCWQLDDAAQAKDEEVAATTASTLSEYCMHLLAFAPRFLPDHSAISESILEQSVDEAGQLLKGAKNLEQRCKILMDSTTTNGGGADDEEAPLVVQGARLARHLMDGIQEPTLRWKVLSDFWAEMVLYVSPSDDARVHLEALARGGEFVTHLWALLTHAGVLKRGYTRPLDVV